MCALGSPRRLMLLAMTFNVYVFFAIMLGFALGALLTGHHVRERSTASAACEARLQRVLRVSRQTLQSWKFTADL